jgi:hypothetical protein
MEVPLGILIFCGGAVVLWAVFGYASRRLDDVAQRLVGQGIPGQSPRDVGALWTLIGVMVVFVGIRRLVEKAI